MIACSMNVEKVWVYNGNNASNVAMLEGEIIAIKRGHMHNGPYS